jgi:elongation factor P--(R)-beta-lysine ligase
MEPHLHPFQVKSAREEKSYPLYLHTSPEFHMKQLLSEGFEKIFQISYVFRDEPISATHRPQFLMLEWYRTQETYTQIMNDIENLLAHVFQSFDRPPFKSFPRLTIDEIFQNHLGFSILDFLEPKDLQEKIIQDYPELLNRMTPLWEWEDLFFLLFLNKLEPLFKQYPYLLLYEWPAPLSALSTLKKDDPRVCERFEVYLDGFELCNCFNELTDLAEQKKRFALEQKKKKNIYEYELPEPEVLYRSLEKGLPPSSGIALGVERLLMSVLQKDDLFFDSLI